ncbi:MAG TPA: T9SS type A sorting domain-containing protein, partial [Rhodothermales bacterium]|nr:T9SS type A sorting domain-containing protein [Rhodothermales bacterium]
TLSLTDETGIAALDLTEIANARLVALDPKPDVIKEGPEGEIYYAYFDTPLRINAVLEKISLREDIDFTLIVRDPCNPPFVLNWDLFWENRSKQAAAARPAVHLAPAYPNPFNPEARFTLTLDEAQPVAVTVYDVLGRVVARLHEGPLAAGQHTFRFGDATWASGLYIYEVVGANLRQTHTITLLR